MNGGTTLPTAEVVDAEKNCWYCGKGELVNGGENEANAVAGELLMNAKNANAGEMLRNT